MKKGYKTCPFCANEIKEKAIKCQYCGEFLKEKEKKQCPFCLNDIEEDVERCPFCDEVLDKNDKEKKEERKIEAEHKGNQYPPEKRVGRKEFGNRFAKAVGLILLRLVAIAILAEVLVVMGLNRDAITQLGGGILGLYILYLYWYKYLLLKIKRLHDLGLSGWWVIVTYIPFINIISFILLASLKSKE